MLEEKASIENDKLNKLYNREYNKIKKNNYNKNTLDLIVKYKLYCKESKKLFNILYNKKSKNKDKLMEYICTSLHFAIEAYYTPCTVNVVVIEMQGGYKVKLNKINYICSIIENLGDLLHHIGTENNSNKKLVLLKYSKYVYRIYYSIGMALGDKKILTLANKINKQVIPHRSTFDTTKVNYKLLNYNNEPIKKYLEKITDDVLKYIIFILKNNNYYI